MQFLSSDHRSLEALQPARLSSLPAAQASRHQTPRAARDRSPGRPASTKRTTGRNVPATTATPAATTTAAGFTSTTATHSPESTAAAAPTSEQASGRPQQLSGDRWRSFQERYGPRVRGSRPSTHGSAAGQLQRRWTSAADANAADSGARADAGQHAVSDAKCGAVHFHARNGIWSRKLG